MIYTVTFNPAVDYLVYLDQVKLGAIQRSQREAFYFSGKGINVSYVLQTLGVTSTALGFLAGFTGAAIADSLTEAGIVSDFCFLKSGRTRINVKIRHGMETDINCQGPEIPSDALEAFYEKLDRVTAEDYVVLSGSVPNSMPRDTYAEVLRRVNKRGATAVVDADGELLLSSLAYRPFLIKPNHEELSAVLERPMDHVEQILDGARELQARGARNVLVSCGGDGALLLTEMGEAYTVEAARGTLVNSIGAGDSMLAGFLAGYVGSGGDFTHALRLGSAAGGATAFSEGLADRATVDTLLKHLLTPTRIY